MKLKHKVFSVVYIKQQPEQIHHYVLRVLIFFLCFFFGVCVCFLPFSTIVWLMLGCIVDTFILVIEIESYFSLQNRYKVKDD